MRLWSRDEEQNQQHGGQNDEDQGNTHMENDLGRDSHGNSRTETRRAARRRRVGLRIEIMLQILI
ncbi:MAG: hypothetical protein GY820_39725 [Gammaproteobacteria bacterium]|nr:hypothetical protein [Gammaproteobacteria bacterium]